MGPVDATTAQLRTAVLVVGGVMALILLTAGFWIERLGLRPIVGMKHVAEAIIAGDRERRVTASSTAAETAELASTLNSMLDQQQAIEARLRQFVADASHELRTPTAAISGLAQLWRQGELRDGPGLQDAMRRIGQESARMKGLVEELLLLARLDEGMPLRREPVDLTEIIEDVLQSAAATHPSRHIDAELEAGVTVPGEPQALRRLAANLISNALNHTPPGSAITVRLAQATTETVLVVSDAGPGMNPSDATHAFDRFWRAETSRTRTGSGLGLSIVQAIVTAHDGHVYLDTSLDSGTRVSVGLPRQRPTPGPDRTGPPAAQAEPSEPYLQPAPGDGTGDGIPVQHRL
jgi:two-component system OmpR family sensor kinase